jgi:hypothetical protein
MNAIEGQVCRTDHMQPVQLPGYPQTTFVGVNQGRLGQEPFHPCSKGARV